jgi:hypothetical protein
MERFFKAQKILESMSKYGTGPSGRGWLDKTNLAGAEERDLNLVRAQNIFREGKMLFMQARPGLVRLRK